MNFTQFFTESAEGKNVHLQHLEDEVLNRGINGAREAINFLRELRNMLSGSAEKRVNVTTKWDGAPAVVCGINPENKKFFVGTKSVFAKEAKLNYTNEDIDRNHPNEGLNAKLKIALEYLPELNIKGVLQGDILFTNGDLKSATIDEIPSLTFQPNTIVYTVPENTPLAKTLRIAKLGIVFHTVYRGASISDMQATFNINIGSLTQTKNVWFRDASFVDASGTATFTKTETVAMTNYLIDAGQLLRGLSAKYFADLLAQDALMAAIKKYQNAVIRRGESLTNVPKFVGNFIHSYEAELNQHILSAKQADTKKNRLKHKTTVIAFLRRSTPSLIATFELMGKLVLAKNAILKKLQQVQSIGTFLKTDKGYTITTPEGFVAVDVKSGAAIKLIDRMEFSAANFNTTRDWTK